MNSIPTDALGFGAESISQSIISYGKSRVAGSPSMSYILCSKAGCMPGQPEVFSINSFTKRNINNDQISKQIRKAFKLERYKLLNIPIDNIYLGSAIDRFTFDKHSPHDDQALEIAIKASYKQVYGNFHAMESERPVDLERRLRNGDISIREFIRKLAKSSFYRHHYFQRVTQQRCIELNFKHLLGRPPLSQMEVINNIELMWKEGFDYQVDSLIDSNEYFNIFGEDTVPFQRCWNSPSGIRTSSFNNTASLTRSFATSDNAIHQRISKQDAPSGTSQLISSLAKGIKDEIKIPTHVQALQAMKSKPDSNH